MCPSTPYGAACSPATARHAASHSQIIRPSETAVEKCKIYIPGASRERARQLVLKNIDNDPSLESLREFYLKDLAEPRSLA
jgi:hypothetical protein